MNVFKCLINCIRKDAFDSFSYCSIPFVFVCIVAIIFYTLRYLSKEGFGTSPGTMVQLRTSHVTTEDDIYYYKYVYPKLVRKEIYNMTESDLHS
jgi:hypothetical protein